MDAGRTGAHFPTTNWTLVVLARTSGDDLEELLRRYRGPIYAFLRKRHWSHADAEDITQQFLADVMVGRDLIGQADAVRGRFRTYLLAALRNFDRDARRRKAVREPPGGFSSSDQDYVAAAQLNGFNGAEETFGRQWAAAVFDEALRRAEDTCRQSGLERHWRVFEVRVRRPALHECKPAPVEDLVAELGVRDAQAIYDMLQTVKKKFKRVLQDVVAETVEDPSDIDAELAELRRYLSG